MPDDYNLGIDNAYNARLRAHLKELDRMDLITHNPQWLGGGPVRHFALSGNNGAYPEDAERLTELAAMGGAKFVLAKTFRPDSRAAKPVRRVGEAILDAAVHRAVGGKINRLKKATGWTDYAVDTADKGLDLAKKGATVSKMFGFGEFKDVARKKVRRVGEAILDTAMHRAVGGKINRLKKATRWTDYAVDTADKGLDLAKKGATISKIFGFGEFEDAARKKMPAVRRAVIKKSPMMSGGNRVNLRAAIVKQVMKEKGLKMIQASQYVKANNLYTKQ